MLKKMFIIIAASLLILMLSVSSFAAPVLPVHRVGEYAVIKNIVPAGLPDPRAEQLQIRSQMPDICFRPSALQPDPACLSEQEAADILANAKRYLGAPYRMGGKTPSGFDCSGFILYVLKHCGYDLADVGCCQDLYDRAELIDPEDIQPGDILFFVGTYATNNVSHAGFYVGDHQMIHAGTAGICYADVSIDYWQSHYLGAGRLYSGR